MRLSARDLHTAALALAFLFCGASDVLADRKHRSLFYEDTPFGSLAWIRGATTQAKALNRLTVYDLTDENCITLPASGVQWFMINHRTVDPEMKDQIGYFSVRILYRTESDEEGRYARQGLHIHRNGNWVDGRGQLVRAHERDSEQIKLSEQDFISLHDPRAGDEDASLAVLEQSLGPWHMKPTAESETSWYDRHLYGARLRAYSSAATSAISARLIRFAATSAPNRSVLFWLDPLGATSALILVDAPRHDFQGSRRVYDVKFGGTCP
jgi:hypothetical protein